MEEIHETDAPSPAEPAGDSSKPSVEGLADTGRRVVEQRMYRALVDHACAMERSPTAQDGWAEEFPKLRASWEILKEKYGYGERPEPAPQADGGSWRGKGGRTLDAASNAEIDLGYARIREVGENVIGPAILRIAAEDSTRTLAGFDRRIKGEDRLKEKVSDLLERPSTLGGTREALSAIVRRGALHVRVPRDRLYAGCAGRIVERLKSQGFAGRPAKQHVASASSTRGSTRNGWNRDLGYASRCSFTRRPASKRRNSRMRRTSVSATITEPTARDRYGKPRNSKRSKARSTIRSRFRQT